MTYAQVVMMDSIYMETTAWYVTQAVNNVLVLLLETACCPVHRDQYENTINAGNVPQTVKNVTD